MKKFYLFALIMTLVGGILHAQAPQGFNYQAVVRNSSGQIISNREVSIRLSILQGSETGTSVYSHTGHVTSNQNGVITFVVGENSAAYAAINWANGPYYLKSEIDVNNGSDYSLSTTQQILSVPYAQHALVADHVSTAFVPNELDPVFSGWGYLYDSLVNAPTSLSQFVNDLNFLTSGDIQMTINGDTLFIAGGNYVVLPHDPATTSIPWDSVIGHPDSLSQFVNDLNFLTVGDIQMTVNGDTLFIAGGNYVVLPQHPATTTIQWDSIIGRPDSLSQFVNNLNLSDFTNDINIHQNGDTLFFGDQYVLINNTTTLDWDSIIGHPDSLSQFVNNLNLSDFNNDLNLSDFNNDLNIHQNGDTLFFGNDYFILNDSASNANVNLLNNRIDSLLNVIDSLSTALAQSMTNNDSLNSTIDSLVHPTTPGLLPGKFSISGNRKIQFSQGNLQYKPKYKLFRFADNQYDIGDPDHYGQGQNSNYWIDLFPYGTSGWEGGRTNYMPYEISPYDDYYLFDEGTSDLTGINANGDWGIYNPIVNGGNQMATWRSLTSNEWNYILNSRANANMLKTLATVNNMKGLILLPDDWSGTTVNMTITLTSYETNNYVVSDWQTLEAAGAVFLPAAGKRDGVTVNGTSSLGDYWSSTRITGQSQASAVHISAGTDAILPTATNCHFGCSVRLVRDY